MPFFFSFYFFFFLLETLFYPTSPRHSLKRSRSLPKWQILMPTFTVVFLSKRISSSSVAYFKYFSPTTRRLDQSLTLTHTARLLVWWYTENIPSSPPQYRNRWLSILHSSVNDIELTLSSDFFFFLLQRLRRLETRSKKANITGRRIFYLKRGRGEKFQ